MLGLVDSGAGGRWGWWTLGLVDAGAGGCFSWWMLGLVDAGAGGRHFEIFPLVLTPGPTQQPVDTRAGTPVLERQAINRAGIQILPSADRLPKDLLNPQPFLDMTLPPERPGPSSTHQWAGTSHRIPWALALSSRSLF